MEMETLKQSLSKIKVKAGNFRLHSDLHLLVDEVRVQFGETAKKGPGSFSFYLGFFKRIGVKRVREILAEIKESKIDQPAKLFWWKIKQETKPDK
jgi:hypothetical protein